MAASSRPSPAPLPALLSPVSRSAASRQPPLERQLLGEAFVQVEQTFALAGTVRGQGAARDPLARLAEEQVVLLELPEGATLLSTAGDLRQAQQRRPGSAVRGLLPPGLAGRLFTLRFGDDALVAEARDRLLAMAAERFGGELREVGEFGVSWLATRLLLQVIEERRPLPPGLYRWSGAAIAADARAAADDPRLHREAEQGLLLFVHGLGSGTSACFGEAGDGLTDVWPDLTSAHGGRIYGFEHHTFSQSPIDNALALARALPVGARLNLVSHGLGGLVCDLLCLQGIEDDLIREFHRGGSAQSPLEAELNAAWSEQQQRLRELRQVLAEKAFRIERYLRVASPARGSRLLGERLDLFLSVLLSLAGALPPLAGNPIYAVFRRLVLEIVRRRTHPGLVPGLAAMLPDSPYATLLARATPRSGLAMATIAGDRQGGHPLQKLALLFSDVLLFERCPNDLVVDTEAMQAGIAARAGARSFLERAAGVSHFQYFLRPASRRAMGRWLSEPEPGTLGEFLPLPSGSVGRAAPGSRRSVAPPRLPGAGGPPQPQPATGAGAALRVACHAMDLRHVHRPVMVGHYEQDPIAGAEALIDRTIVAGELSSRERLGLYAGPLGTATVVLMNRSQEELHHGRCRGAVVIGLGRLGELTPAALTEAVQAGTLRYLLQIVDRHGAERIDPVDVGLAALLLGQNSTSAISIEDSVSALVHGVLAANEQFARAFPRLSVRVGRLQIVEVFLDTAITATHALCQLEEKLNSGAGPRLEAEPRLRLGRGWRHRLDAAPAAGYWPRLLVLGAVPESGAAADAGGAEPLRFSFLGERARAETIVHPHQRALVEALVTASIDKPLYSEDLSRTLFQLLVPTAFKDLARRLDQLVMVLDESTANLPWELLLADREPLALSLAMVRQLQSPHYRLRVRQSSGRCACVIGNPLTTGFYSRFSGQPADGSTGLVSLEGAAAEAAVVIRILGEKGWDVESCIDEPNGVDVINRLYRRPYRILHIAAHGIFEHPTTRGERRTGVVLADGMLITAAEIEAMEVVPDLVVLNCCHLGVVNRGADGAGSLRTPFHRLAASVARQLIEMGVRAVVACGWAVDDRAAAVFAEALYRALLQNRPFGEAVFSARRAARDVAPDANTWGAYQAYGDPAFVLEPPHDQAGEAFAAPPAAQSGSWSPVTSLELIERLRQLQIRLAETSAGPPRAPVLSEELGALLQAVPDAWLEEGEVATALADLHAGLGGSHDQEACRLYRQAIGAHRGDDSLPVRAIEQLAALEARWGEANDDEASILAAQQRLESLIRLAGPVVPGGSPGSDGPAPWWVLLGTSHRRLAAVRARRQIRAGRCGKLAHRTLIHDLEAATAAYGQAGAEPQAQVHRLLLLGVLNLGGAAGAAEARSASTLLEALRRSEVTEPDPGGGILLAEALLALRLLDGGLAGRDRTAERSVAALIAAYRAGFEVPAVAPGDRLAALEPLQALADLVAACGLVRQPSGAVCRTVAPRLAAVLRAVQAASSGTPGGDGGAAAVTGPGEAADGGGLEILA